MSITAPTDISGCKLWLQGDLGLYDAVSGGSLVATDGAAAKRWEDQSGQGNHWTEATNPPARRDSGVNGARSVRFNGTNQLLSRTHAASASLVTLQGGSYTFVWALAFTSLSQDYASWFSKANNGNASRLWFLNRSGVNQCVAERFMPVGTAGIKAWSAGHGESGRAVVGTPYVISYTFALTGTDTGTETFRINGVTVARRTGTVPSVDSTTDFRLGACSVGGTVAFWFPGDLAVKLAYDTALSGANLSDAENYARSYCGMSAFPVYATGKRMVDVGDSLTEGYNATSPANAWPAKLTAAIGHSYPVVNTGSAGIPLADVLNDVQSRVYPAIDAGVAAGDDVAATVYVGTNDLATAGQAATVTGNLSALYAGIRARGATVKIAAFTLTPRDAPGANPAFEADRQAVATWQRTQSAEYDGLVDLAADAAMGQAGDETDGTYYSGDKLHYNDAGHLRVAADALPIVGPWLVPPDTTALSLSGPTGPLADGDTDAAGTVAHNALRTYTVTNNGTVDAPNVAVAVPANTTLVGAQPGTIPPGESRTVRVRFPTPGVAVNGDLVVSGDGVASITVGVTATVGAASVRSGGSGRMALSL